MENLKSKLYMKQLVNYGLAMFNIEPLKRNHTVFDETYGI